VQVVIIFIYLFVCLTDVATNGKINFQKYGMKLSRSVVGCNPRLRQARKYLKSV
jgi:hypothetical protein